MSASSMKVVADVFNGKHTKYNRVIKAIKNIARSGEYNVTMLYSDLDEFAIKMLENDGYKYNIFDEHITISWK